jgi:tetratricopeptide (TPR) repeat protein
MKAQQSFPLLVVAAGLLAYHNSCAGSFFHDDFGSILENPTIRHLWPIWQPLSPPHEGGLTVAGRPLINLSLAINYALGGYNVWGYHALNLTVHILAGLTLLGIVRRTLLQPALRERFGAAANELALAVAVLWTVHPLQTESVTYIIQRAESIMGLFYLLTLYCFIRGAESPRAALWYGLSVTACALGMASKEVMVSAPLMVMLYDRAFLSGPFREAWRRRWRLYLALASTWIVLGLVVVSAGNLVTAVTKAQHAGLRWWEYLVTQPGVIVYYLRLSVWPSPLRLDHAWPIAKTWMSILPPTVVIVILLGASAEVWKRNPAWGFVGAWFFLILAPSSSFIPLQDALYEHRMYLSLAAVVSLAVMGLYSVMGRRSLAVFVVMAVGLGFLTWRHNEDYRKNAHYSLGLGLRKAGRIQEAIGEYRQALRTAPNDAWLHYNLGVALYHADKLSDAIVHFEQALRLKPDFAQAHYDWGVALTQLGRVPEAIAHWEQALRIKPDYPEAHENLATALARSDELAEAIGHYEQALRLKPDYAEAHSNLADALRRAGRMPEAVAHWEQALRINPSLAEAHYNLGLVLSQTGKIDEAVGHYEQALRINPDFAEAHNNLGTTLLQEGKLNEAIGHYEQALRLKPDYAEAHYNLGVALAQSGKVENAIRHLEQALQINPDFTEAQNALARLRVVQ